MIWNILGYVWRRRPEAMVVTTSWQGRDVHEKEMREWLEKTEGKKFKWLPYFEGMITRYNRVPQKPDEAFKEVASIRKM